MARSNGSHLILRHAANVKVHDRMKGDYYQL